jgi:hypothetical protein
VHLATEQPFDHDFPTRRFAKAPTLLATKEHEHLPLHLQSPPVPMLSWDRADEIVLLTAPEPEARAYFCMSAPYRDGAAAERIHAGRDRSKDSTTEALLFGDDIKTMLEARFCELITGEEVAQVRALLRLLASVEEKPTGSRRRLLGWPRAMNEAERAVLRTLEVLHHAKVPFPTATSTRDIGMRADAAASLDFKKFFQQFKLLVWQFYVFCYKGDFYRLATIPTGAVGPPIFAQVLSRAILALAVRSTTDAHDTVHSDCMIDNLRLVSNDMHLLRATWHQLLNICDYVGITVGEAAPPAVRGLSPYTFLGIRFVRVRSSIFCLISVGILVDFVKWNPTR